MEGFIWASEIVREAVWHRACAGYVSDAEIFDANGCRKGCIKGQGGGEFAGRMELLEARARIELQLEDRSSGFGERLYLLPRIK